MEIAYRAELVKGCPDATDDLSFHRAIVEASAFWVIMNLGWHLEGVIANDSEWGAATVRQRIMARLAAFANMSEQHEHLPALAVCARSLLHRLDARWPAESREFPLYPAFR